jgi:hypothetical protein
VTNIIERFRSSQGSIELFTMEGRAAAELLASNPLAGFCLALNHLFRQPVNYWPLAAARTQMNRPQREILSWLGFQPATEAIAKLGRKCLPEALNVDRSMHLRQAMADPETRATLAHLPQINAGVIGLVATPELRQCLTPQLLHSVAHDPNELSEEPTAELLRDTVEMHQLLKRADRLPRFHSRRRVVEVHDALMVEIARRGTQRHGNRLFPPPPISGVTESGKEIRPVRTLDGLFALGREQHNCVGSYTERAAKGQVFIYRVCVNGEICTLSLVWDRTGTLQIDQFKTTCNRTPSKLSEFAVRRWLEEGRSAAQYQLPPQILPPRTNRSLPRALLGGGASGSVHINPIPDQVSLLRVLGNWTAVEFYTERAKREQFYEAVTPQGPHLIAIQRRGVGFRLKELRRPDGGKVSGEVLVAVGTWLGRAQRRYR